MSLERTAWVFLIACLAIWTFSFLIEGTEYIDEYAPEALADNASIGDKFTYAIDIVGFTFQVLFQIATFGIGGFPLYIRVPLSILCGLSMFIAFGRPLLELIVRAFDAIIPG